MYPFPYNRKQQTKYFAVPLMNIYISVSNLTSTENYMAAYFVLIKHVILLDKIIRTPHYCPLI